MAKKKKTAELKYKRIMAIIFAFYFAKQNEKAERVCFKLK